MRFLFVDKISEIDDKSIVGSKYFSKESPMQYSDKDGELQIAPGVISEAVGQLVSWLCIKNNDFTARPVFLFADEIEILEKVAPGSNVELKARIDESDEETFVFSGEAYVDGKCVHRVASVNGYFMPLGDLEDPEVTKKRFQKMMDEGLELSGDKGVYDFDSLVDVTVEKGQDSILVAKTMRESERFFDDHFPRFPVTPIVMINEMIGNATARLVCPENYRALVPTMVKGIKIRNFVRPGETVQTSVSLKRRQSNPDGTESITTLAEVKKGKKIILRGKYEYVVAQQQ